MSIVFGFLKFNKPGLILNPGIVETLAGLHIAIEVLLSSSKYKTKDQITKDKINRIINGKSIGVFEFDDNQTALVFGISPYIQKYVVGFDWANCVWHSGNCYTLEEHPGHEATARLLVSQFKFCKINDQDYPSAKFSGFKNVYEICPNA